MLTAPIVPGVIFAFSGYDSETLDRMLHEASYCHFVIPNLLVGSTKRLVDERYRILLHPTPDCVRANNDLHISFRKYIVVNIFNYKYKLFRSKFSVH